MTKNKVITAGWWYRRNSLEFVISNIRSNNRPCIWVEYCGCWKRLKFWIKISTLIILSGNIWSKLKSPTIEILRCVGSLLINKTESSVVVPRGQGIWYTITNNKVSFSISSTTGNNSKALGLSIIIIPNRQVVQEKLHSEKSCNLIDQWLFDP